MLFSSLEFLFLFLPTVLVGYYLLPRRFGCDNLWLLLASLVFYAWGEPTFVFVMVASIVFNWLVALAVARFAGHWLGTVAFWTGVAGNLELLGAFKYLNFLTETIRSFFPWLVGVVPQTSILLPIGISFFTFQSLSYLIDVRRGESAQRNPLSLALYIALFPQLIAGPIVRYSDIRRQLSDRRTTPDAFASGVVRFVVGLNKKVLLANVLAEAADAMFADSGPSVLGAWLGAVAYTFQIYFDFSGYSDMAIGLGRMFGFSFRENFDHPYASCSVTEFWRRWHMSLGSWFKDYVYIPLGGSRVGRMRFLGNLAVVWLLTGLWHGANWTFILWGGLYGIALMVEKAAGWPKKVDSGSWRCMGHLVTLLLVVLGWVLFRSESVSAAWGFISAMFGFGAAGLWIGPDVFWCREVAVFLVVAALCSVPPPAWLRRGFFVKFGLAAQFALLVVSVSALVMKSHNPFIYFNF